LTKKPAGLEKVREAAHFALEKKASDLKVLDLQGIASFTDYFVICSGDSTTQVKAIVDSIEDGLVALKLKPLGIEGRSHAHWVLMDYGDVVVHVFERETREYYELEKLWLDAPEVVLADEAA
jgi:ribosome-associated protein